MSYLIVGLGNPGKKYEKTRHNIGFEVVKEFVKDGNFKWRLEEKFLGEMAEGDIDGKRVYFLLPHTYMNESGTSVKRVVDYFKIEMDKVLIVVDDVEIERMRLKKDSGPGGHKGLRSVEANLGSGLYARLRIGIGGAEKEDLVPHVLGRFTKEEEKKVSEIILEAKAVIAIWLKEGIEQAMNRANVRTKGDK